jgi:hypothetical protein
MLPDSDGPGHEVGYGTAHIGPLGARDLFYAPLMPATRKFCV